jgi:3-dehydroquinate synthase
MNTLQSIGYPVYFEDSLSQLVKFIEDGHYSRFFILTDENTAIHCLPIIRERTDPLHNFDIIEINAGEESKDIDFCIGIWKMLVDFGADRNALMINLGGGVVSDLGGFVASTYKRGIDFVNVPTTLLAQVDASVGGKTGIDIDNIKNIIGTFTQPKAVFIDHEFLRTLPQSQVLSGTAEMLKHGLIADAAYWHELTGSDLTRPSADLVHKSISIKNKIVVEDPHEKGIRKALNFGHTIGHAVEANSLKNDEVHLSHGAAVAIGMICEAWLSHQMTGLPQAHLEEIVRTIRGLYPHYPIDQSCHEVLYNLMLKDKKNTNGQINCTLLTGIGQYRLDNICTEDELCQSLKYYADL